MALSDASDSTLLSNYRTGLAPTATHAQRRSGGDAVFELVNRHRARAYKLRNQIAPSLTDENVEDVLKDAVLIKSRHERLFRIDDDRAKYSTWLTRVLRNGLISALRKESYRKGNEVSLTITARDEEVERDELSGVEDEHAFVVDDMLREVLDTVDRLSSSLRFGEEVSRTFLLRHLHAVVFPGKYARQPGRAEVMAVLAVTERRARTLIDHADALVEPFRDEIAKKFDVKRPDAA